VSARVAYLNDNGVDRAVSISCNDWSGCTCCSGQAYGTETFKRNSSSGTTNDLANRVQSHVVGTLGTNDRGVKTSTGYAILNTNMPHVYLFAGFLSDSGDSGKLKSDTNRNAVGKTLMRAIQSHFGYAEFNP
jgi:N-acetylmuramoyl-L-alanine amidase